MKRPTFFTNLRAADQTKKISILAIRYLCTVRRVSACYLFTLA